MRISATFFLLSVMRIDTKAFLDLKNHVESVTNSFSLV